ncbi:MAG: hypothetical protein KatS3mg119_2333 [Rhodothalassiaceae bacterium]|nr:MAG: hypothetical protein KatS3mg119_2333 [Rhodothalassiaceae bacterium]
MERSCIASRFGRRRPLTMAAAALGCLLTTACGQAPDSEHPTGGGGQGRLPEGESLWHLRMKPAAEDGRISVRIFPRTESTGGNGNLPLGTSESLNYELFLEKNGTKLRRCAAKDDAGKYVTSLSCELGDGELTLSLGRAEEGQIVMRLQPEEGFDRRRWTGNAAMHHPALPLDVTIGTVEMVPAGGDGTQRTGGRGADEP